MGQGVPGCGKVGRPFPIRAEMEGDLPLAWEPGTPGHRRGQSTV